MATVIRIEDYPGITQRSLAAQLRRLAAARAASLERMRQAEDESIPELASRILAANPRT